MTYKYPVKGRSIDLTALPTKGLTIPMVDEVMTELAEQLGEAFQAVKLSGTWFITKNKHLGADDSRRGRGESRNIDRAISDATGYSVIRKVPFNR